ncbi:MAG: DUF2256 domain-containing protein [Cellvibrionaceae bacterium]
MMPSYSSSSLMKMKKSELPEKICIVCQRPFTWRKKWQRDWDKVKYCSKRCSSKSKKMMICQ